MPLSTLQWIILMTLINGLIGLVGIFSLIISKKFLKKILLFLVAFSVGSLLGGAFFHLIPEALEQLKTITIIILILIGITLFYLIEKFLHWHHCHKTEKCDIHPYTHLILYGDSIHNFIDGLIIASSFIIGIPFGILTSLLIMLHELPQEIGDFAVLVHGGFTKRKAILYNFITQLTSVLGGVLGFFFLNLKDYAIYLLPFAAGGFIYIAIMDLIPEVFKQKNISKIIINILAIIFGLLVLISGKLLVG